MRHDWTFLAIERGGNPRVAAICRLCGLTRVFKLPATEGEDAIDLTGECPAREGEAQGATARAIFGQG